MCKIQTFCKNVDFKKLPASFTICYIIQIGILHIIILQKQQQKL